MNRNNQEEKKQSERQIYNSNRINFYSTPYFGPIYEDRNSNVIRNYHGVNSGEKRYQNYIPNNNHFYRPNYFNRKIYNSNHRAYYLGDFTVVENINEFGTCVFIVSKISNFLELNIPRK